MRDHRGWHRESHRHSLASRGIKTKISLRNISNARYRSMYRGIAPLADYDKDGVRNIKDCYPFDRTRHGKYVQNIPIEKAPKVSLWHATAKEFTKRIKQEGLKPRSISQVRPPWYVYDHDNVYLTRSKWGVGYYRPKKDFRLFKVTIPVEKLRDPIEAKGRMALGQYTEKFVPPEYLKEMPLKKLSKFKPDYFTEKLIADFDPDGKKYTPDEALGALFK